MDKLLKLAHTVNTPNRPSPSKGWTEINGKY